MVGIGQSAPNRDGYDGDWRMVAMCCGLWDWRTVGLADCGTGGLWDWRTVGLADCGRRVSANRRRVFHGGGRRSRST